MRIVKAQHNCKAIFYECDQLGRLKVSEVDCWEEGSDLTVSRALKKDKKSLEEDLKSIKEFKRNLENIFATHDITEYDVQCSEAETLVDRVSVEVRKAVDAI